MDLQETDELEHAFWIVAGNQLELKERGVVKRRRKQAEEVSIEGEVLEVVHIGRLHDERGRVRFLRENRGHGPEVFCANVEEPSDEVGLQLRDQSDIVRVHGWGSHHHTQALHARLLLLVLLVSLLKAGPDKSLQLGKPPKLLPVRIKQMLENLSSVVPQTQEQECPAVEE